MRLRERILHLYMQPVTAYWVKLHVSCSKYLSLVWSRDPSLLVPAMCNCKHSISNTCWQGITHLFCLVNQEICRSIITTAAGHWVLCTRNLHEVFTVLQFSNWTVVKWLRLVYKNKKSEIFASSHLHKYVVVSRMCSLLMTNLSFVRHV